MRTKPILSDDDICNICNDNDACPECIYDCDKLNDAIRTKKASYVWCWIDKK